MPYPSLHLPSGVKSNSFTFHRPFASILCRTWIILALTAGFGQQAHAQIVKATQSGFTWISTENVADKSFGAGYTMYAAAWPIFKAYPGPADFQTGLSSSWLTTQKLDNQPQFYTTIEGGLGWWHDTRFGTRIPKFIMGGVSYNFYAWANGPGAGRSDILPNGQRDWSTPGGKYGVAQLSNHLLWAPDGLNLAQALNGELLGYGYTPLPLIEPLSNTNGTGIATGNQCWTLFLNATNFKGVTKMANGRYLAAIRLGLDTKKTTLGTFDTASEAAAAYATAQAQKRKAALW